MGVGMGESMEEEQWECGWKNHYILKLYLQNLYSLNKRSLLEKQGGVGREKRRSSQGLKWKIPFPILWVAFLLYCSLMHRNVSLNSSFVACVFTVIFKRVLPDLLSTILCFLLIILGLWLILS